MSRIQYLVASRNRKTVKISCIVESWVIGILIKQKFFFFLVRSKYNEEKWLYGS